MLGEFGALPRPRFVRQRLSKLYPSNSQTKIGRLQSDQRASVNPAFAFLMAAGLHGTGRYDQCRKSDRQSYLKELVSSLSQTASRLLLDDIQKLPSRDRDP